ncbi:carbonic anhydrase [Bacillus sp. JZ8]
MLEQILEYNKQFVEKQEYKTFETTKFPNKKCVILTCMDTRLIELLPASMNLKNGDAKIVKSAGAVVSTPFGGIMRSLIVAIYELGADEVFVIGHHDCGMSSINPESVKKKFVERGITEDTIHTLENAGVNLDDWLRGFDNVTDSVQQSVDQIRNHPLVPNVPVHGLVIDPATGKLDIVDRDEKAVPSSK